MSEYLVNKPRVVAISGPDGGGKGYLTAQMLERIPGLVEVAMVTTRPPRGESETKIPISIDAYQKLLEEGQLIGNHINKGNLYAYQASDFAGLSGNAITELNPALQQDFAKELAIHNIEMVGWIGLVGEPEYLRTNIQDRTKKDTGKPMDTSRLDAKLDMANTIMEHQRRLAKQGVVTIFKVGWDNRDSMGEELAEIVRGMFVK